MILKFLVELMESALSQAVIAFHQERAVGALGERFLPAFVVNEHAEFHVDVGQLRKRVVVTIERGTPRASRRSSRSERTCGLIRRILCSGIFQPSALDRNEFLPASFIVDRLNFRHYKSGNSGDRRRPLGEIRC